jgi:hypothetical protein
MTRPNRLGKADFLRHWSGLKRKRPLRPRPVPYRHSGSTFDQDGIRITGSREFIDAVLSRLTELLPFENAGTRLQVNYQQAKDRATGAPLDSWTCYIQVHQRGDEARMVNAFASGIAGREVVASRGY